MRCPSCEEEAPDGKRFCVNCGAALVATCARCSAPLLDGERFCGDCGTPVANAPLPTLKIVEPESGDKAPMVERRLCSVLFVDLVGFTPLAEKRDPEEVRELLSRYFDRAQTIVGNYGGTVEKFIGDAVMAVWGAPTANEDDAERAVRAGRSEDAVELYAVAIDACRALNCSLDVAITELELVHLLGPDHPAAVAGKEARDIFTQLGATPFLARLDAAQASRK